MVLMLKGGLTLSTDGNKGKIEAAFKALLPFQTELKWKFKLLLRKRD
jgi:hypothetical protein